jgi:hypothetical protein
MTLITTIKDIITILATIIATTVAVVGLSTWRKQLKGKTEYESAQKLLITTYKTREAVSRAKSFFKVAIKLSHEIEKELKQKSPKSKQTNLSLCSYFPEAYYQEVMTEVQSTLTNLDLIELESEVLWGKEIQLLISLLGVNIKSFYIDLQDYRQVYFDQTTEHAELNATIVEQLEKKYRSIDVTLTINTVKSIEKFLTPYLRL